MENELLEDFELGTIGTENFDSDLFWFDSDSENDVLQNQNYDSWIEEWFGSPDENDSFDWDSNLDISGTDDSTEIVGTEFNYEELSEDEQLDFDLIINVLVDIFDPDSPDSFVEALGEALSENGDELIFRDGYGRELTDEEIEQIEGIGTKTKK